MSGEAAPPAPPAQRTSPPLAPLAATALRALLLVALFVALAAATGDLTRFLASGRDWWDDRDARLAVLLSLLIAAFPPVRRAVETGVRGSLEALRGSLLPSPGFEAALRGLRAPTRAGRALAGAVGVLLVPLTALLVDRDPGLYLRREYWHLAQLWEFGLGGALAWNVGTLLYAIRIEGGRLSELARRLPRVDLLDPGPLEPFARAGLFFALPGLVLLSFLAFNLGDRGWLWASIALGLPTLAWSAAAVMLPMRGVSARIRRAKADELGRVDAAIRGDAAALAGSAIERRAGSASLADLLAYRAVVASASEWPLPPALRARFVLYLALPLGSWLGGAVVERVLDAVLG